MQSATSPRKIRICRPCTAWATWLRPKAPQDLAAVRLEEATLADLVVKLAYTVPRFTTDWVCQAAPPVVAARRRTSWRSCAAKGRSSSSGRPPRPAPTTRSRTRAANRPRVCWRCAATSGRRRFAWSRMRRCCAGNSRTPRRCSRTTWRPPCRAWSCRRRPRKWPAWPFPPDAACSSTGRRGTAKAASAGRFTRPCRAITGSPTPSAWARA